MHSLQMLEGVCTRRGSKPTLTTLLLFVLALFLSIQANAANGLPEPSTGTYADYYVSWNTGDDANPGTIQLPFKTPERAIGILRGMSDPSGKIVLIRGGTYRLRDDPGNRLFFRDVHGKKNKPVEVRGYPGEKVMLDAFLEEFDPLAVPYSMACGWGGISISDCSHLLVENFKVQGRCQTNVELLNSDFITLRYIEALRSDKHGLFTGGSFTDLTVECCKFYEHIYGSTASHGIYITGGHWDPTLPPVRNVKIRYTESYYNGRHGIQFNGRMENVTVDHCNFHHNHLGGISVIGVRNMLMHNNLIYKNNKQGIILYTYFDTAYWDPSDPQSVQLWKDTHWTIENVWMHHNTIFMDDKPWYVDEWTYYEPKYHAGIYLAETSGLLPPFKNIVITNNIVFNHSKMIVNFVNPEPVVSTWSLLNLCNSGGYEEGISCLDLYPIWLVEYYLDSLWRWNVLGKDPLFQNLTPTQTIDGTGIAIDWSQPQFTYFPDNFQLKPDSPAALIGAGAFQD